MTRIAITVAFVSLFAATAAAQEPRTLTLEEALESVRLDNFDVQRAAIAIDRAALIDAQADALWRPNVDASAAYTFFDDDSELVIPDVYGPILPYLAAVAAADPRLPSLESQLGGLDTSPDVVRHQHDVRGTLTVRQPIYQPIARPLRRQADAALLEAEAGRAQAVFAVRGAVQQLYFEAVAQRRVMEATERNVALAEINLRRIRVAAEEQVAGEFEVNRAEVALARAQRDRDGAATGYRLFLDALAEALNRPPDFDVVSPPTRSADDALTTTDAAQRAEGERFLAAATRFAAEEDAIAAEGLPMVVFEASATGQRETAFEDPVSWHLRVGLQWSIFDGGMRRVRREQAALNAAEAQLQAREVAARADAELRRAALRVELATLAVAQARRERDYAERNVEVTREAWAAGDAGFIDVETAQQQSLLADVALANAEVQEQAAIYEYLRLV